MTNRALAFSQHTLDLLEPRTLLSADGLACGCETMVYRLDGTVDVLPLDCVCVDDCVGGGWDENWTDETWLDQGWTDQGWTDQGWTDQGWTDEGWIDNGSGDGWTDDDIYEFGDGYVDEGWVEGDWTDWEEFTFDDGAGRPWYGEEVYAFELAGMAGANFRGDLGGDATPIAILPAAAFGSAINIAAPTNEAGFVSAELWNYAAAASAPGLVSTISNLDLSPIGEIAEEDPAAFVVSAAPDAGVQVVESVSKATSEPAGAVLETVADDSIKADASPLPVVLGL